MYSNSEKFNKAIKIADDQIGQIWKSIQYHQKNFNEGWLMIIITDYDLDEETGKHHGGKSERERMIWIITSAKDLNPYFTNVQPEAVSIMPTIARFMELNISRYQAMEIDGVSLIGPISIINSKVLR